MLLNLLCVDCVNFNLLLCRARLYRPPELAGREGCEVESAFYKLSATPKSVDVVSISYKVHSAKVGRFFLTTNVQYRVYCSVEIDINENRKLCPPHLQYSANSDVDTAKSLRSAAVYSTAIFIHAISTQKIVRHDTPHFFTQPRNSLTAVGVVQILKCS
jgi:hypothetical protein